MTGVSSLTSSTPARRSSPRRDAGTPTNATPSRRSPRKSPAGGGSPDDDNALSPHVPLPDLAARISDNDSVASGDDSIGWARESERVITAFAAQAEAEMAINDAEDAPAWGEIDEWIVLADANAEEQSEIIPPLPPPTELIRVLYSKCSVKALKEIAMHDLGQSVSGNKRTLFNRLRDCQNATKVDDDTFEYQKQMVVGEDGVTRPAVPRWVILTPEDVPDVEGVNMATGAEEGFFAPTNKENSVGGKRANFLTAENFSRPDFGPRKKGSKRTVDDEMAPPPPVRDDGHPSQACRDRLPKEFSEARAKDYFDTQLTPDFFSWVVTATNLRAYASGAGSGEYKDFLPFDLEELNKMMGVLFANGLAPKPQVETWFQPTSVQPLMGNDLISREMCKRNFATKTTVSGLRRWKHFRRYLTFSNYQDNPKEKQKEDPLWKIRKLVDHLNKQCKDMWVPGKFLAIDEQTIGFQGASGMKLRISYKREGDGFQCDAVCDRGYTFSFWFRHGDPPKLSEKYKKFDLSPLHSRVVWLAERLPNRWTRLYMDNLFNSEKLFSALNLAQCLAHGVVRTHGRGFPEGIIQREEKNLKAAEALRGTTKAAHLTNSTKCPDLLAVSIYDTKPVHLLSTTAAEVRWIVKQRGVWSAEVQKKAMIKYLRLNVIEEYNSHMNSTDIADQLRGNYRPDRWMRQRKWWWSFFIWAIGVALVNAYKIYECIWAEEKARMTPGHPKKMTHAEFREQLIYDLIFGKDAANRSGGSSSVSAFLHASTEQPGQYDLTSYQGIKDYVEENASRMITKERLENGYFKRRLDGMRHNWVPLERDVLARCQ